MKTVKETEDSSGPQVWLSRPSEGPLFIYNHHGDDALTLTAHLNFVQLILRKSLELALTIN